MPASWSPTRSERLNQGRSTPVVLACPWTLVFVQFIFIHIYTYYISYVSYIYCIQHTYIICILYTISIYKTYIRYIITYLYIYIHIYIYIYTVICIYIYSVLNVCLCCPWNVHIYLCYNWIHHPSRGGKNAPSCGILLFCSDGFVWNDT